MISDRFQHKIIQIGIKKAVNIIINKAKPSIPKTQFIFIKLSQEWASINWKWVIVGSKIKSKAQQIFRINNEKNSPKLRINLILARSMKDKKKAPTSGKATIQDNINIL